MANWVFNRLHILGEAANVNEVFEAIRGELSEDGTMDRIDFNKIMTSKEMENSSAWSRWIPDWDEGEQDHIISFRTAWAPAIPVAQKLSSMFPKVTLKFIIVIFTAVCTVDFIGYIILCSN
jgi:hypothetical protein